MKKIIISVICLALVVPMFNGCKKGENDPMSLKSRKARLTGEWELAEWQSTSISGSNITTINFSGSSKITLFGSFSATTTYSESIEIMKDGTYESKFTESDTSSTYSCTSTGGWFWVGKNKELEYKNKERVGMQETSSTCIYTSSSFSDTDISQSTGDSGVTTWRIDMLKSKEMVVVMEYTALSNGDLYSVTETRTYEKQ